MREVSGFKPRFNLYTVPGQSMYHDTRRMILDEVNAIVFVADSRESHLADNERAFREMKRHLIAIGYYWLDLPLVLQYNKQDLTDRVSETILQPRLNPDKTPLYFDSMATEGLGVTETLRKSINMVLVNVREQI